jgi:hypothetical protein
MQIPPVEDEEKKFTDIDGFTKSKAFQMINEKYTLTIQNRQKENSKLFTLINTFRTHMDKFINIYSLAKKFNNNDDILFFHQDSEELKNFIKKNNTTAVCFKNNTADYFNYKIGINLSEKKTYNIKDINEGDILMFDSFYYKSEVCFYTSEMIKILKIFTEEEKIKIPSRDKVYEFSQKKAIVKNESGFDKIIWLPNVDLRNKIYGMIYNDKKQINNKEQLSKLNTFYSDFMNGFAKLKKPYGISAHKSQGTTIDNVIIPVYDFYKKNYKEANQLVYVAMSRASKKIIFVNGWCNFNSSTKRVRFTEEERCLIAGSQNWKCNHCEENLLDFKYEIDHEIRLGEQNRKGKIGTNNIENLQALCKECHKEKTKIDNE